ncbi:hypothetical protein ACWKWU_00840 [Chitinophaga lutea]
MLHRLTMLAGLLCLAACASPRLQKPDAAALKGVLGTYGAPPRQANGRADLQQLLKELNEIHATTYHWLIWQHETDWEDLQAFLPLARKAGLKVWATVVPPSESKPIAKWSSEPYGTDYIRWAQALAELGKREPNLIAWSIDDFAHNLKTFTPGYTDSCRKAAAAINPRLAFIPCLYYKQITPAFAAAYGPLIDGVLFPYRAESAGANLKDPSLVGPEIATIRKLFAPGMPVYIDIYATAHSRLGPSSPDYVRQVIAYGREYADGVLIYCHQDPVKSSDKYAIIQAGFEQRR